MTNFFELTDRLALSKTEKEKLSLSRDISTFLKNDPSLANAASLTLARKVLSQVSALNSIMEGDFFTLRIRTYKDSDQVYKIALGVSFLQEHTQVDNSLDFNLALSLVKEIRLLHLDLVINDVTVNREQLRDFDPASAL